MNSSKWWKYRHHTVHL